MCSTTFCSSQSKFIIGFLQLPLPEVLIYPHPPNKYNTHFCQCSLFTLAKVLGIILDSSLWPNCQIKILTRDTASVCHSPSHNHFHLCYTERQHPANFPSSALTLFRSCHFSILQLPFYTLQQGPRVFNSFAHEASWLPMKFHQRRNEQKIRRQREASNFLLPDSGVW